MPGDPRECREHAKQCLVLAVQSSPLAKAQFEQFARIWARLAADIERSNLLLQRWGDAELKRLANGVNEIPPGWKPIDELQLGLIFASASMMPSARIAFHFPAKGKMGAGSIHAPAFVLT